MLVKSLTWALALFCSVVAAAKQPDAAPPKPPAANVKLQITSVSPIAGPLSLLGENGQTIVIQAPRNNLSPVIEAPAMKMWIVGKKDPGTGQFRIEAQGKPINSDHQILVITPDGNGGKKLTAIEGRPGIFKFNTVQYLNASTTKVAGDINKDRLLMIPDHHQIMRPDAQLAVMKYKFFYRAKNGDFKAFHAGAVPTPRNNTRFLIIFYPDQFKSWPKFQMVRIQPPPPAQAKPKPAN